MDEKLEALLKLMEAQLNFHNIMHPESAMTMEEVLDYLSRSSKKVL